MSEFSIATTVFFTLLAASLISLAVSKKLPPHYTADETNSVEIGRAHV